MSEIQLKATNVADKPVRLGDLPVVKTNILENAGQMDKGVVGGYNGTFPLTAASQGGIYLLPSTGKFYVCETAYNGTQISAPNSNFVELSVWKNHDRLANLINIKKIEITLNQNSSEVFLKNYRYGSADCQINSEKIISLYALDTPECLLETARLNGSTIFAEAIVRNDRLDEILTVVIVYIA